MNECLLLGVCHAIVITNVPFVVENMCSSDK